MAKATQAGKLGHYTWIIDEIMIEEAKSKSAASSYTKPFADAKNNYGIQNETIASADINDLITLIGNFFGSSFTHIKDMPIEAKAQKDRTTNTYTKKILKNSNELYQILNVATPEISQPDVF